jgi:hypothetical protein
MQSVPSQATLFSRPLDCFEDASFEYRPPFVASALQEGVNGVLENIDQALAYQAVGRLSIDPEVYAVNKPNSAEQMAQEQAASEAFYRFIGKPCVQQALECAIQPEVNAGSDLTLADSIPEAKKGDPAAEARVDLAITSATGEAFFKREHFTRFTKRLTPTGKVVQHDLTTEQIHLDAIMHRSGRPESLKRYTLAEVRNGIREEQFAGNGILDDAWMVGASFVPKNMPEELLDNRGEGFFTRTMTYSLQGSTKVGAEIVMETVFDVGTDAPEEATYEQRQAERFDLPAYQKVCEWLGLPVPATELEALESPLIIPKALMPNGMIDFWRWMHLAADEIRGKVVVRTVEDYVRKVALSQEREQSIAGVRQAIKQELLTVEHFAAKIDAVDTLWELARTHGYRASARNEHIDPIAFGVKGARKLKVAKHLISLGQDDEAERWIDFGLQDATVSGCGGGSCGLREAITSSEMAFATDKLDFQEGDSITASDTLVCPHCDKAGGVIYVYNPSKVNKGCKKCGAVELGG